MTMMVRNEADVIAPVLDHHLAQGVDLVIVTDNASTDGTTEILREYQSRGLVDLRHDSEHRKQQSEVVTTMARDAYTVHGADWVVNADADEFFLPCDRTLTLRDALERIPKEIASFTASTVNLVGEPALDGTGLQRLVYRDLRPADVIREKGLLSQPIPNAIHVGHPDIVVGQGNHLVDLASLGSPEPGLEIENLHLPWRSWAQLRRKVEMAGTGYELSPERIPGPDHHGMRDRGRQHEGSLFAYYLVRHPLPEELDEGLTRGWLVEERVLADRLDSPVPDVSLPPETFDEWRRVRPIISRAETQTLRARQLAAELEVAQNEGAAARALLEETDAALAETRRRLDEAEARLLAERTAHFQTSEHREISAAELAALQAHLGRLMRRPEVRVTDAARRRLRRLRG
ncbi:glycosyltransferase family 2 protein [Herbiconiux liangxiaofengii]|uniref:glycosyltransferase family 2 protein n=1 Tax=Herbiconiux liangxiaofengii TaxID=3342795 RepID=UPI0035BA3926